MDREQWIFRIEQALNSMLTINEKMENIAEREAKLEEFYTSVEKHKNKVRYNDTQSLWGVVALSIILCAVMWMYTKNIIWVAVLFVDFGIVYVAWKYQTRQNEQSDEMRKVIEQSKREEHSYQAAIETSKKDLEDYITSPDVEELQKTIPEAYATMDAVVFFLTALHNMRADNLKEAINLYEEELHKRQMLDLQQQEMDLLKKSIKLSQAQLKTQEQMAKSQAEIQRRAEKLSKQVRFGNVFHVVNTVRHWNS